MHAHTVYYILTEPLCYPIIKRAVLLSGHVLQELSTRSVLHATSAGVVAALATLLSSEGGVAYLSSGQPRV